MKNFFNNIDWQGVMSLLIICIFLYGFMYAITHNICPRDVAPWDTTPGLCTCGKHW